MSSNGSSPWKKASSSSSRDSGTNSTSTRDYPDLSARILTKTQQRNRALYSHSPRFDPYPPRVQQLNRQELNRQWADVGDSHERKDNGERKDHHKEHSDASRPPIATMQGGSGSGISSVVIYREDEERRPQVGPDLFYRRRLPKRDKQRQGQREVEDRQRAITSPLQHPVTAGVKSKGQVEVPTPFTQQKLDTLLREMQRKERVQAIEQRNHGPSSCSEQDHPHKGMQAELIKAFSSLDGFLAAFGKEGCGDSDNDKNFITQ